MIQARVAGAMEGVPAEQRLLIVIRLAEYGMEAHRAIVHVPREDAVSICRMVVWIHALLLLKLSAELFVALRERATDGHLFGQAEYRVAQAETLALHIYESTDPILHKNVVTLFWMR